MSQISDFEPQSVTEAVPAVAAAAGALDYRRASDLADKALANGLIHPAFYNAKAIWLEQQRKDDEALGLYQQARVLTPRDARLLNAIGLCLTRLSRFEEALETFDEAIRITPAYAPTHHRKGLALGMAGRLNDAERAHARAAQLDPGLVDAVAALAAIAARRGKYEAAARQGTRAIGLDPANATAHTALAMVDLANGAFAAAEARLRPLLDNPQLVGHGRAVVLGLLGDALDGLDRPAEAFAAYSEANAQYRNLHAPRFAQRASASAILDQLVEYFSVVNAEPWKSPAGEGFGAGTRTHMFLLGFPRSGTTLLEQALEAHGEVVTLEEQDFLAEAAERYLTSVPGLERLSMLDGAALEITREAYWQRVRGHGLSVSGKVFVDKHPFNTIKLPLIAKLFPHAKIILAVRDPRDVVLSCFRRHLDVDQAKFELLTLDGAARLYDRTMRFAITCLPVLPLKVLEHRYEDLVADFDGMTRKVCEFAGIEWTPSMRKFADAARTLDDRQASAQQVRRGLYTEGVGQWRRYATELAPVMDVLKPWVEKFGYI